MPERLAALPETVFDALAGVDMVVHTGDIGELWVLDQLSRIAPVLAVHGNDDTPEATHALPYLLLISAAGHRVLVTHGHFADPIIEGQQRIDDNWYTSFARWTPHAQEHGASVMLYGHSHIPSVANHGGVWLINPGALASASIRQRQSIRTVARVTLQAGQPPKVVHIDIDAPDVPHVPPNDYEAGFSNFYARYTEPIFAPDLMAQSGWIRDELVSAVGAEYIADPLLPLARECWAGARQFITAEDAVEVWMSQHLPHDIVDMLRSHPLFGQYVEE
jgi:putative phosphoesterase